MTPPYATPISETERQARRIAKRRPSLPDDWADPLDELRDARARALLFPDGRPASGGPNYRLVYEQLRSRAMKHARIRFSEMQAMHTMVETQREIARALSAEIQAETLRLQRLRRAERGCPND